jgi:hypothetical protein
VRDPAGNVIGQSLLTQISVENPSARRHPVVGDLDDEATCTDGRPARTLQHADRLITFEGCASGTAIFDRAAGVSPQM